MDKPNIRIGGMAAGGVGNVVRPALAWLRLVDDPMAPAVRALVASFACLPVAYLMLMWYVEAGNIYAGFTALLTFAAAWCIWITLIVALGWKLSVMVFNDYRAGRFGTPEIGKPER